MPVPHRAARRPRWRQRWMVEVIWSRRCPRRAGSICSRARCNDPAPRAFGSSGPTPTAALPFARPSIASCSTRRAPASARSGGIPTSAGGERRPTCRRSPRRNSRCSAGCGVVRPGRTPGLRDLLERARGKRGGREPLSALDGEFRTARPSRAPSRARPFVDAARHFRTLPFRDGLEAFFAAMLVKTKDLR